MEGSDRIDSPRYTLQDEIVAAKALYPTRCSPWQTRLLQIDPPTAIGLDPTYRLHVVDIIDFEGMGLHQSEDFDEVLFDALSYEWGDPTLSDSICVNGIDLPIRSNLAKALHHIALAKPHIAKRYIWIDALCINQHDNIEKSRQVGRMLTIYKKARRVVAWNPQWNEDRDSALLSALRLASLQRRDQRVKDQRVLSRVLSRVLPREDIFDELLQTASKPQHLDFIQRICCPTLLKRTWIRQEFAAAREMVMQFGPLEISWKHLMKLDNGMHESRTPRYVYPTARVYSSPADLELMRNPSLTVQTFFPYITRMQKAASAAESTRAPLLGILLCTPYFQVSDSRDHLFGVIGFSDFLMDTKGQGMDDEGKLLKIDYSLSFSQVYQNITYYFIKKTQSLYILSLINDNQDIELPSWTVDWRTVNTPWGPLPGGLRRFYNGQYTSVHDYMEPGALGMIGDFRKSKVGSSEWQSRLLGLFLHELARRLYSTTERSLYHNRKTKKQYWHHFGRMMDFDCKTGDVRLVKNTLCVRGTPLATLESGNIEDEPCTPFLYLEGTSRGGRPAPGGGGWEGYVQYSDLGRFKRKRLRKAQEWAKQNLQQWYDEPRKDGMITTTVTSTVYLRDEIMPLLTFGAATPWLDIRQDAQVHCWMTRVAMVPRHSKEGDQIVLLHGCAYPFLLRPSGDKWKVIGITLYPLFCQAYKRNAFEICDMESMDIWRRVFGEQGPKASQQEFQLI